MKKFIAMALTLCLALTLFACGDPTQEPDTTEAPKEKPVTVRLLKQIETFAADGTKGFYRVTYTYDGSGRVLTRLEDRGPITVAWDEELGVYIYEQEAYDGTVNVTEEFTYDPQGSWTGYRRTDGDQDADGLWDEQVTKDDGGFVYTYDESGKIQTLAAHSVNEDGTLGDRSYTRYYRYDEQGRLTQVDTQNADSDTAAPILIYRYDEDGRVTDSYYNGMELDRRLQYVYDEDGLLTKVVWSSTSVDPSFDGTGEYDTVQTVEFEYDSGKLISRKHFDPDGDLVGSVVCDYDAFGDPATICYYGSDGNMEDSFSYTHELTGAYSCVWEVSASEEFTRTLHYDKDGLLTRIDEQDGAYTLLTYEEAEVSPADAERIEQMKRLESGYSAGCVSMPPFGYEAGAEFARLVRLPEDPLWRNDLLRSRAR